jgi:3-oxoacyl-[acyl-carrier-protein] synthase-3
MSHEAYVVGTGAFIPERVLTNQDMERIVDTSDEWITTRTGIKERRVVDRGMATTEMSTSASRAALDQAGIEAEDIDLILVGTVTPDYPLPSTAALVQERLGAVNAAISDVAAACAGFIYGLATARAFVGIGQYRHVLVVGAETLTSITNYLDRNTCVLFGDGAGAAVVSRDARGGRIVASCLRGDGRLWKELYIPKGGSLCPLESSDLDNGSRCIRMNGNEVFKYAVRGMLDSAEQALAEAGMEPSEVNLFVPHQANLRIMDAVAKRLRIPDERVVKNIAQYGNTSSASVPIGLDEARRNGRIRSGDAVLLSAFGAGFCWGSTVIQF